MKWDTIMDKVLDATYEIEEALYNISFDIPADVSQDVLNDICSWLTTIEDQASDAHDAIKKYIKHEFHSEKEN